MSVITYKKNETHRKYQCFNFLLLNKYIQISGSLYSNINEHSNISMLPQTVFVLQTPQKVKLLSFYTTLKITRRKNPLVSLKLPICFHLPTVFMSLCSNIHQLFRIHHLNKSSKFNKSHTV